MDRENFLRQHSEMVSIARELNNGILNKFNETTTKPIKFVYGVKN